MAKNEVDFTTKVSPRRVEPLPRNSGHGTRAVLYIVAGVVVAGVLAAVIMMWSNTRAMQRQLAEQAAERKAEFAEMADLIAETRDEDRRAIYEQLNQFVTQSLDEQRKSMTTEYKQFVNQSLEEERRTFAQSQKQDYVNFVAVLTAFKSKAKNGALKSEFDRVIAIYRSKIGGNGRRESASNRVRPTLNQPSGSARAD